MLKSYVAERRRCGEITDKSGLPQPLCDPAARVGAVVQRSSSLFEFSLSSIWDTSNFTHPTLVKRDSFGWSRQRVKSWRAPSQHPSEWTAEGDLCWEQPFCPEVFLFFPPNFKRLRVLHEVKIFSHVIIPVNCKRVCAKGKDGLRTSTESMPWRKNFVG